MLHVREQSRLGASLVASRSINKCLRKRCRLSASRSIVFSTLTTSYWKQRCLPPSGLKGQRRLSKRAQGLYPTPLSAQTGERSARCCGGRSLATSVIVSRDRGMDARQPGIGCDKVSPTSGFWHANLCFIKAAQKLQRSQPQIRYVRVLKVSARDYR